ncbi:FadR/GntR family transcriptional regulator [Bradyrhizobium prioriisuperbiae]|uniref:FadR/GntR family transcriptional regulator n=1 Tax=Bradyrhizobium prioriisuperbiae TaxID=2854389 RepID=UPI0028EBA501|nr:FadR/GntR family transcriptional regulator [Bradyrhizobium prioritasuperba]
MARRSQVSGRPAKAAAKPRRTARATTTKAAAKKIAKQRAKKSAAGAVSKTSKPKKSPPFQPLAGGRKSEQVFAQISQMLRAGQFATDSRLPPERELASMFRTSRQTVREAIYHAELVGLIETRHGTGSFVVGTEPQIGIQQPLIELIRTQAHRIGEFFEIRRALEGWCASHAAKVRTDIHLRAMKAPLQAMRTLDVAEAAWERNDVAFHQALAAATGNPLAMRMMELLRDGFSALYRLKSFVPNREDQHLIWQHHADILDAVRTRKPDKARDAIVAHMDFVEAKLAEGIGVLNG